jgi:hypothetical protein
LLAFRDLGASGFTQLKLQPCWSQGVETEDT